MWHSLVGGASSLFPASVLNHSFIVIYQSKSDLPHTFLSFKPAFALLSNSRVAGLNGSCIEGVFAGLHHSKPVGIAQ